MHPMSLIKYLWEYDTLVLSYLKYPCKEQSIFRVRYHSPHESMSTPIFKKWSHNLFIWDIMENYYQGYDYEYILKEKKTDFQCY